MKVSMVVLSAHALPKYLLVKEKSALFKSMLASKNLPKPITNAADGQHWIRVLAAELALRLKDAREEVPTLWPKAIVLHARKGTYFNPASTRSCIYRQSGYETSRSKQAAFPFTKNVTVDMIASAGNKLWKELTRDVTNINVTSVQLAFTGIEAAETGQQMIHGFFKTRDAPLSLSKRPRSNSDRSLDKEAGAQNAHGEQEQSQISFVCERCQKRIALDDGAEWIDEQRESALAVLRQEHDDFHFAQDLATNDSRPIKPRSSSKPVSVRSQGKEPKGIAKFFSKK